MSDLNKSPFKLKRDEHFYLSHYLCCTSETPLIFFELFRPVRFCSAKSRAVSHERTLPAFCTIAYTVCYIHTYMYTTFPPLPQWFKAENSMRFPKPCYGCCKTYFVKYSAGNYPVFSLAFGMFSVLLNIVNKIFYLFKSCRHPFSSRNISERSYN